LGCPPRAFALHEADAFVKKLADQSYADALRSMTDYVADNLNSEDVVSRLATALVQAVLEAESGLVVENFEAIVRAEYVVAQ